MARKSKKIECTSEQLLKLKEIARSKKMEHQTVQRSKIILECIAGKLIKDIARKYNETETTIRNRRDNFITNGIQGLYDLPRSGAPKKYGEEFRNKILNKLEETPPYGLSHWDGSTLAKVLKTSADAIWRLLKKEGIFLSRQRTWCVSTDPEFTAKAADVVGLYLNPPTNAIVISVDEKPSIQALSRPTGYVKTSNKKIVNGIKSTYKRNGTINLFGALEIATGTVYSKTTETKKRPDFLAFMDETIKEIDIFGTKEIHVILDNYCIHKKCDEWLLKHPNVHFHFTPTSASWLNQIEIFFGIFSKKVLRGASFNDVKQLIEAIKKYVKYYNKNCQPFVWRKREVKGSQLRNTIKNLCN
ncbi:MAG TPA: IS630 family transposase [bacterium]|nr:IS630 family transposase [bacterium]